ncbi:sulfurtransferase complex subunit TusB [Vibrio sp. T187]|uniref:sulfurtransferase complex subunit TusB n=1 Tax=Vibrio TaxID=662 RepID=UPI0010C94E7E|nr:MULTISPECIES: sulfurtransferase complex subunit TusB [Vibrio]MBW3697385.1 sulfurtransferase complex subunit TusB [Vibrio sp. T187]
MLHIIKSLDKLPLVFNYIASEDHVLLVENAVYAANPNHQMHSALIDLNRISVLEEDCSARGLVSVLSKTISMVSFSGFVELTVLHNKSMTW